MGSRPNKRHYLKVLWSVAVLLAFSGAGVIWLFTADLGIFKPQLERIISERTGRQFAINGELDIRLGRSLTIKATNLELGNAEWAATPVMFSVGRLSARVNLWSIFSGPVIVDAIDIDGVILRLTENEDRDRNWAVVSADRADEAVGTDNGPGFLLKILAVDAVHVIYESAYRPAPIDIRIFSLRNQLLSDDMLDASITAVINGRDVKLRGAWGTWTSMLAGGDIGFDVRGQLDTISLQVKGRIDDLKNPSRPEFDFAVMGPSIADLWVMLGLDAVGEEGDINLSGSLGAENDGLFRLRFNGNLGLTRINTLGRLAAIDNFSHAEVKLSVGGPNLGHFLSYFGVDRPGNAPFELALDLQRREQELLVNDAQATFGDSHFEATARIPQFPTFKDAVVSIEATGKHVEQVRDLLGFPGVTAGPFSATLNVNADGPGQPRLETVLHTTAAEFRARGLIGDPPDYRGSQLDFELVVNSLLQIGDLLDVAGLPEQPATALGAIVLQENRIELQKPLQFQTESLAATISGSVERTPQFSGAKIQFEIEGADLLDTSQRFNADLRLPSLPYKASGVLDINVDSVALQHTVAELGSSKFRFEGSVGDDTGNVSGTHLKFSGAGSTLETLFSGIDDVGVLSGAFTMAGEIRLSPAELAVENFKLERKQDQVTLDARISRPFAAQRMTLWLDANGPDVRSVFNGLKGFEPDRAPFSIKVRAERDGSSWSFLPFEASFGNSAMEVRGQVVLAPQSASGDVTVKAKVANLAQLGTYAGRRFRPQPLRLNATLSGDNDRIVVDSLEAGIGVNHISGRLTYRHAPIPDLELDLQSESLTFLPIFATEKGAQEDVSSADGRVIPDVEIPFDVLRHVNAVFSFDMAKLQRDDMHAENAAIRGRLLDGTLNVESLRLDIQQGNIAGRGTVAALDSGGQVHFDVTVRNLNHLGADVSPTHADIDLDITATGTDLRQLAQRTNGFVALYSTGGEFVHSAFLEAFYGGIADKLLDTINPWAKSGTTTKLVCTAFLVDIVDGVIQGSPSTFLKTDKMRLLANTEVNLATETISVDVRSRPSGNLTLLSVGEVMNPYLGIGGTLGDPRIVFDEKGALIAGSAAVATGGLSIIAKGFWDRMKGGRDPCSDAADQVKAFVSAHRETPPESE